MGAPDLSTLPKLAKGSASAVFTFADIAGVKPNPMRTGQIKGLEFSLQ